MHSLDHKKLGLITGIVVVTICVLLIGGLYTYYRLTEQPNPVETTQTTQKTEEPRVEAITAQKDPCTGIDELWQHVYHGRFKTAEDRLELLIPCVTVTGKIVNAVAEKDGDWHIRMSLDAEYNDMLNAKNKSMQHGYLVLEPVCENQVTQRDTIQEGVCKNFSQNVFTKDMIGKHVEVTGSYVLDVVHGWNEIHPVSEITPIK